MAPVEAANYSNMAEEVEVTERPPSYQGGETNSGVDPSSDEKIIGVDAAIESIGFGKFQRRVL